MKHHTVSDVMTTDVVAVAPDAPFKKIARIFHDQAVSAVAVVDEGHRPIGVVSEADLLRSVAELPGVEGAWRGVRLLSQERGLPEAETAADLMSAPVITASADWSLTEAARHMQLEGVKRLIVTSSDGALAGVVSRRDLLRPYLRSDEAIHGEIVGAVLGGVPSAAETIRVQVRDGVVTVSGDTGERAAADVARLCRSVEGVVAVRTSPDTSGTGPQADVPSRREG
ncbi:CBS domain-containing protein [Streptomyces zhihengii]